MPNLINNKSLRLTYLKGDSSIQLPHLVQSPTIRPESTPVANHTSNQIQRLKRPDTDTGKRVQEFPLPPYRFVFRPDRYFSGRTNAYLGAITKGSTHVNNTTPHKQIPGPRKRGEHESDKNTEVEKISDVFRLPLALSPSPYLTLFPR